MVLVVIVPGVTVPVEASPEVPGQLESLTPDELQITRFYRAVLDRDPDPGGMAYWYALISTGSDPVLIAESFAQSAEFELRFGVPPGPDGDLRFLDQVYRNVLDRRPDAAGRRYWAQLLNTGVPRSHIVMWFAESTEFGDRTGLVPTTLPPFESTINTVTTGDLGVSWRTGCPVPVSSLRKLSVSFVTFQGRKSTGEIVVHADSADDIVVVFERLYLARYPIESMRTIDQFGGSDDASMDANNTSAFNCRRAVSGPSWSRHAYGLAVDINPLVNPYVKGSRVLPPAGSAYADRSVHNPALIREGDAVVQAFDSIGWSWGGRWTTLKDYQHFSSDNR